MHLFYNSLINVQKRNTALLVYMNKQLTVNYTDNF